ncbi:hypothetical protein MTR67_050657, partial [Solanum verrucosum]
MHMKKEVMSMTRNLEVLENSKRRFLGEDLESCSIDELEKVEGQLDQSLRNIRAKQLAIQGTNFSSKRRGKSPNGEKCRIAGK